MRQDAALLRSGVLVVVVLQFRFEMFAHGIFQDSHRGDATRIGGIGLDVGLSSHADIAMAQDCLDDDVRDAKRVQVCGQAPAEGIRRCRNLVWLILPKRPERIEECLPPDWNHGENYPHVWLGVTCGERESFKRVDILRKVPCALRFLSCEPLIEDISDLDLSEIGWVLCGGMSGSLSKKYPMDLRWTALLYDSAQKAGVPFLFKQISHNTTERGINALGLYLAEREGRVADPATVDCVRQYPEAALTFIPPEPKGVRLDADDWAKIRRTIQF